MKVKCIANIWTVSTLELYAALSLSVVVVMAFDVLSGVSRAIYEGTFKSSIMRRGFWKKVSEVAALFGLIGCETAARFSGVDLSLPFGFIGGAGYIVAMEGASIVENLNSVLSNDSESETGVNNED